MSREPCGASDIADVILFLASDSARRITGAVLDVNGGMVMARRRGFVWEAPG